MRTKAAPTVLREGPVAPSGVASTSTWADWPSGVNPDRAALESGFTPLPFTLEHAAEVARLPDHHRDPFDRALVAQARLEPLHLVTCDEVIATYGEPVLLL